MNKAEKSLRWVVSQIPDFKPTTNEEKMLVAIKLYSEAGAEEIKRLEAENAALRERLEKAIELPCIEPMTTWDWDDTTGCGKSNFGKYWQVLYRDVDGEFIDYIGATKEEAEKRLAELKGESEKGG